MGIDSILENRKNNQRNKMLSVIRSSEDISRNDVKKITGYSMTTVLSTVDEMIHDGLIYEESCNDARVGRRPVWLRINPEGGYFIGVGFNRSSIYCVTLDFTGKLIYDRGQDIEKGHKSAHKVISLIKEMIHEAVEFLGDKSEKVVGIGLGVPGYSDVNAGLAISYSHIRGWSNIPIQKMIEEEFHTPCYMDNNVNVMIFAYKWLVYHGECEDMLFVSIRTGARVIPIVNNQPVSGAHGFSGELGHVKIKGGSRLCACGRYGCLNSEISDVAIVNKIIDGIRVGRFREICELVNGDMEQVTMAMFADSVKMGHEDSINLLKQIGGFLGDTLSMLVNIFAPRKIVLFGELAEMGDLLLKDVRKRVSRDSIKENSQGLEIVASEFGKNLGAMGAAALVMQKAFEFGEERI
ncbi:MAG: ROK family protein [Eubacteriales bacterium]|nr:ROK family protein [Eubacteriales bacterium]